MLDPLVIVAGIILLTIGRLWYLKVSPVLRDVVVSQIPFSKRLRIRDFFRKPVSQDVRDSFRVLPYGTLWFAINIPLMRIGGFESRRWTYAITIVDAVFIWISFMLGFVPGLIYAGLSTFMLFRAPWNVSILWLTILGVFSWIFLILAPVAKLPVGIPMRMGKRVQGLVFHQHNYIYYSLLGSMWLLVLWRTLLPGLLAGSWIGQLMAFQP